MRSRSEHALAQHVVEQLVAAAAALLGAVHRGVGVAQQVLGERVGALGDRDPDARGDEVLAGGEDDRLVDRLRDALGHPDRLVRAVELLADDEELVAAEPGDRVGGPHRVVQPRRQRHEQVVAGGVAERIVDELELVEVGEQHRDGAAVAPAARERALEAVERQRPVRQRGERIVQRAVAYLGLDEVAVDRARGDVRHGADEVELVGREPPLAAPVRAQHAPDLAARGDRDRDARDRARVREQRREGEARLGRDVRRHHGQLLAQRVSELRRRVVRHERPPHLAVGPADARHQPQGGAARRDLEDARTARASSVSATVERHMVHDRLEILLLEREAPERGDRGLLARLASDRLLCRALLRDVLHVRVEPAVAALARHEDRFDGRPDHLAVGPQVALDEALVSGPAKRAVDHRAAAREVVRVRHLGRGPADELARARARASCRARR